MSAEHGCSVESGKTGDSPTERLPQTRRGTVPVLKCEAVNLLLADCEQGGQEVPHIHLHVIPRFREDGFGLKLPPGHGRHPKRSGLDGIAAAVKS